MIIAVDNNQYILDIIKKIAFKFDIEYKTFLNATDEFFELVKTDIKKIYILDIKTPLATGIDIAKKIRKTDLNSTIILTSAYEEVVHSYTRCRLSIYTFIYKLDDFINNLKSAIKEAIEKLYKKEEILIIEKIKGTKKCLIKTNLREYEVTATLKSLKEKHNLKQIRRNRLEK